MLTSGTLAKLVHVWQQDDLADVVTHRVVCKTGFLKVWNIYQIGGDFDPVRAESWTNNSGMVVEQVGPTKRVYRCSDGLGDFDSDDLVFEIEWMRED